MIFCFLWHVGTMCIIWTDLRQMIVGPAFSFGDLHIMDVSPTTNGIVNQMPLLGSGVHPCCFALVSLSEEHVGDRQDISAHRLSCLWSLGFILLIPWRPSKSFQLKSLPILGLKSPSRRRLSLRDVAFRRWSSSLLKAVLGFITTSSCMYLSQNTLTHIFSYGLQFTLTKKKKQTEKNHNL